MSQAVRYERRGSVGIIAVDHPPVNALSPAVRVSDGMSSEASTDALLNLALAHPDELRPEAAVEGRRIALQHWS